MSFFSISFRTALNLKILEFFQVWDQIWMSKLWNEITITHFKWQCRNKKLWKITVFFWKKCFSDTVFHTLPKFILRIWTYLLQTNGRLYYFMNVRVVSLQSTYSRDIDQTKRPLTLCRSLFRAFRELKLRVVQKVPSQIFSIYSQFHQHFMSSFWDNVLSPKNYTAKLQLGKCWAKHFKTKKAADKMFMKLTPYLLLYWIN